MEIKVKGITGEGQEIIFDSEKDYGPLQELAKLCYAVECLPEVLKHHIDQAMYGVFDLGNLGIREPKRLKAYKDAVGHLFRNRWYTATRRLTEIGILKRPRKNALEKWEIGDIYISDVSGILQPLVAGIEKVIEEIVSCLSEELLRLGEFVFQNEDSIVDFFKRQSFIIIEEWESHVLGLLERDKIVEQAPSGWCTNPKIGTKKS